MASPIAYGGGIVALLAEGVDRNLSRLFAALAHAKVALLAEGVDRNWMRNYPATTGKVSPSSRRAWIEIGHISSTVYDTLVALLAEGVDRNA